ncbi:sulfurtransferase complex subunit TusB [Candidatus Palibaumannia cicadellinicola]|uniref:tRNA 5-methylaminomethyl-2-thiouridine synthase n=1 Tax=Candidatus Palibaumannia cicadellinicola TaxID=186490 RepID=A0A0K2BLW5_9GAMM|nr:sulfurtransferase complex subunit TusB [Candidatus Baumannia cicadellinicola]AKZ66023.1 tRNA 5-methylaminomethyl-2-thiouridine synthase [Candidatus Baumannia cicadellinicola]
MLVTISHSPYLCDLAALIRSSVTPKDVIVLWADGVIAGLNNSQALYMMLQATPLVIYALNNDIIARGLSAYISNKIVKISYTELVIITEKYPQQIAW